MLTQAWTQLEYHEQQSKAWRTKSKFVCLCAGRGSGKTEIARRRIVRYLPIKKPWPDPMYFYALPTYAQAKRVAWRPILALIPDQWISGINVNEQYIETIFGSVLYIIGMDNPHRVEGVQWDGGVIDESSDQKSGVFDISVLPALSHRDAWCWRIGVPKRYGIGAVEFKEFFDKGLDPNVTDIETYHWPSSDIIPQKVLESAKTLLDERDYREQFEASWEVAGGLIFYTFEPGLHVSADVYYDPEKPIFVGSDFNVTPMSWTLSQEWNNTVTGLTELHTFDEISINNSTTERTLNVLARTYGESHTSGWEFYGDATGRARKTAAADSDYVQIRNDDRFYNKKVRYPAKNPAIVDRFASCTALLKNAKGDVRFKVHPKCKNLIKDLRNRVYLEGTRLPDDKSDIGHMSDAWGYVVHRRYPLRRQLAVAGTPAVYTQ